jgi:iron complex outermembrane receptor protein
MCDSAFPQCVPELRRIIRTLLALCAFLIPAGDGIASAVDHVTSTDPTDLTALSLEQLMSVEVTSVSKKSQKISDTAAAVHVISQEDIHRSGATSIPDLLRMVPGLEVARIDANKWAISARGFNGRFANKLLVLMDGRTLYDPTYSGVFWDVQDTLLEDIDRIEVIRGPGATLWGANAVNGVINVITKHSRDTRGGLLTAGAGTEERGFAGLRYGGQFAQDGYARAYIKYFDRDSFDTPMGENARDDWTMFRGGGRMDWQPTHQDGFTLQGDVYSGSEDHVVFSPTLTPPFQTVTEDQGDEFGGNILGRWQHKYSETSEMALQLYYDRTERKTIQLDMSLDTLDLDFQHRFKPCDRHDIIWGFGYRLYQDSLSGDAEVQFDREHRTTDRIGFFVQDEIELIDDMFSCLIGTKLESNTYSDFEIQPNLRLLLTPSPKHTIWGAISRAVRTPSRGEFDARFTQGVIPGPYPTVVMLLGDDGFESEELLAYEAGYRWQAMSGLSFDLAIFYNDYSRLRSLETGRYIHTDWGVIIPIRPENKGEGETYGLELVADWRATPWWHFQAAYTFLRMDLDTIDDSTDTTLSQAEGESPRHQLSLRSMMNLPNEIQLDSWLRYVDALRAGGTSPYITLDARLAWRPFPGLELALVGQNLLDHSHPEFSAEILENLSTEVPRSFYGKITWRF